LPKPCRLRGGKKKGVGSTGKVLSTPRRIFLSQKESCGTEEVTRGRATALFRKGALLREVPIGLNRKTRATVARRTPGRKKGARGVPVELFKRTVVGRGAVEKETSTQKASTRETTRFLRKKTP